MNFILTADFTKSIVHYFFDSFVFAVAFSSITFHLIYRQLTKLSNISTKNENNVKLVIAIGPAGTGKTMGACQEAIKQLKEGNIKKIVPIFSGIIDFYERNDSSFALA